MTGAMRLSIYVICLKEGTDEDMLVEFFGTIGLIRGVIVHFRKRNERGDQKCGVKRKGDATISYEGPHVAAAVVELFNNQEFRDCRLHGSTSRCLKYAVLEGSVPFTRALGMPYYEYLGKHPEFQIPFNKAMSDHSTLVMREILKRYKGFEGLLSLVDVGGNIGTTLGMICSKYPQIKGINFDQPHIIADATPYPGVEHVAGNIFVSIPKGDAIFLKWIFHGFTDDQCIKILKNCYAALPEDHGKVIVCEYLLPGPHEPTTNVFAKSVVQLNTIIMCMQEGKERSKQEYEALAFKAGFQSFQVVCSAYNVYVMEFLKKT